ncbi:MAG TPA: hypothetical protein VGN63_09360 [Flavisolibacter sp.]|jgi:hypothetical protein|nr:hypothetical protein [Flavisolibacter sp.]
MGAKLFHFVVQPYYSFVNDSFPAASNVPQHQLPKSTVKSNGKRAGRNAGLLLTKAAKRWAVITSYCQPPYTTCSHYLDDGNILIATINCTT